MSKTTQNDARANAKGLAAKADTTLSPIATSAGLDSSDSRARANTSLEGAGETLKSADSSFGSMAATGGFTPEQEGAYLNRATEAADASSEVLQNQSRLASAKTGQGDNGGAVARIARQLGQVKSTALNDAQVGLNTQKNSNKLAGASGQAEVGRAKTSVGSVQAGMAGQSAQQQMAALGLQFNTEAEAQDALTKLSFNKGPWDNTMQAISLATGQGNR